MTTNTPCPRCGKTNPADVHTCTPKEVMEQELREQDQSTDSNPIGYLLWDAGLGWWEFVEEEPVEYYDYKAVYAQPKAEPEAEPVAWIQPNHLDKAQFMPFLCRVEPKQRDDFIPLYTRPEPAIRKPMTKEEIDSKFKLDGSMFSSYTAFKQGVRCAEEFHGIGVDDE